MVVRCEQRFGGGGQARESDRRGRVGFSQAILIVTECSVPDAHEVALSRAQNSGSKSHALSLRDLIVRVTRLGNISHSDQVM
jgi:hypothetical protein